MKKTSARPSSLGDAMVVQAATALQASLEEMENLTARIAKIDLANRREIVRAAELLDQSLETHKRFLTEVTALSQAVSALRDRQNESAERLSACAEKLDTRRREHEALEQRFLALGEAAKAISEDMKNRATATTTDLTMTATGHAMTETDRLLLALTAVEGQLVGSVEAAQTLATDCREAGFDELERQADAIKKQLHSLLNKLSQLRKEPS